MKEKIIKAFLKISNEPSERMQALRMLSLYMLKGYANKIFQQYQLDAELHGLLEQWQDKVFDFNSELDAESGMARIDIGYVLYKCGNKFNIADSANLANYLQQLVQSGDLIYGWLCGELAYQCGVDVRIKTKIRPYQGISKLHDLYWITHQYLLATGYLHQQLPKLGWEGRAYDLLESVPWAINKQYVDLAAEIALCLQLSGKQQHERYHQLIKFIEQYIKEDGTVVDPVKEATDDNIAHCTAAALLVFSHM